MDLHNLCKPDHHTYQVKRQTNLCEQAQSSQDGYTNKEIDQTTNKVQEEDLWQSKLDGDARSVMTGC